MVKPVDLLRQNRKVELWQMCCGFIDLSVNQFITIQKRLLLEQIELLKNCRIGAKVMRGKMPNSVEEFMDQVPITNYGDYCPELQERREYVLPAKPVRWIRTSGYSGTYDIKWVPMSEAFEAECEKAFAACTILAMSRQRGDVSQIKEHLKVLYTLGGPEYASGAVGEITQQALGVDFLPSTRDGLAFTEKIKAGFAEALYEGLDGFGGLSSVLVSVADQMQQKKIDAGSLVAHPKALLRLSKAFMKSRLAGRSVLPKDIWDVKGILGTGTDSAVFKSRVEEMWGKTPLELYGGTEGAVYATQTWDRNGMTFLPNLNFLEFMPEEESLKWRLDSSYKPRTLLLDKVEPDHKYELIITNLHGGALVRYRLGDVVRIISLRNEKSNINLPQMVFHSRADYLIDIAGLGRLTERIIWEALENTGIPYVEWTARKEVVGERAVLHLYIEPKYLNGTTERDMVMAFTRELQKLDRQYHHNPYNIYDSEAEAETLADSRQVEVTLLPQGAFANYIAKRQAEGADLGHLKPPHINPKESTLAALVPQLSPNQGSTVTGKK